jgi:hypothetical protein
MKISLSVLATFFFISSYCQEIENLPIPEYVNTIYAINNNNLVALEKQEASTKVRTKAGSYIPYVGLFVAGQKASLFVKDAKSPVRFNTHHIKFIYEPSIMIDPEQSIKIIPFESEPSKDQRSVQTGVSSVFRSKNNEIPKVPFTYRKYKEKYIIIEIDDVPTGEYGIVFTSNDNSNLNTNLKYQLFGIN